MENGPHGLPFSIPHQYSRKATVSSDTVAFIALFLINQLIQLGNMMRAGCGLVLRLLGVHDRPRSADFLMDCIVPAPATQPPGHAMPSSR